jgi:hypothetical protein
MFTFRRIFTGRKPNLTPDSPQHRHPTNSSLFCTVIETVSKPKHIDGSDIANPGLEEGLWFYITSFIVSGERNGDFISNEIIKLIWDQYWYFISRCLQRAAPIVKLDYCIHQILLGLTSRRMRWAENEAAWKRRGMRKKLRLESLKIRDQSEDLGVDGKYISNSISGK